jgi:hypothetical protein
MYERGIAQRAPRAFEIEAETKQNEILKRILLEELSSRGLMHASSDSAKNHPSRETILRLIAWLRGVKF